MFKLERALKTYREAGSLNAQVNLFGFIDDHAFLTKSVDLGRGDQNLNFPQLFA